MKKLSFDNNYSLISANLSDYPKAFKWVWKAHKDEFQDNGDYLEHIASSMREFIMEECNKDCFLTMHEEATVIVLYTKGIVLYWGYSCGCDVMYVFENFAEFLSAEGERVWI